MLDQMEGRRLDALYKLKLLDTSPSESFDRITRMASQIFGLPTAAVSLTDSDRQWFKSRVGVDHTSIPRDRAPCAQVAEMREILVIEDILADKHFATSLLGRAGTRFYAGAPLITRDGYGLGALCVLGTEPRQASRAEMTALVDLAAMVMAQIELEHAFGRIDPVSGMPNSNQFCEDLSDLARDHPGQQRIAVVIDLARDKQISKIARAVGRARIDEIIREASDTLRSALGPDRTGYHVGATQFAFLSPPEVDEQIYIQQMHSMFQAVRPTSSVRFVTTVAIGLRSFTVGTVQPNDVLRSAANAAQDADTADGSIAVYSSSSDGVHRRQYRILQDFEAALEAGDQLRLVYQPRVSLATGRCVGAEALLRWEHPQLGDISPGEFMPILEQTSLARPVTRWVLNAAMDQLAAWKQVGLAVVLSVNVSAANLAETDLVQSIKAGLLKRDLRHDCLEIELTESVIMDQPERALAILCELAAADICLAIDDFGTGHSSLAYLQRLPAQVVKIDQTFVRNLVGADGADYVLVETMIGLAHKLGYRVVAEGVETCQAANLLSQLGCEEAQGFLFARPMESVAFSAWVADRDLEYSAVPLLNDQIVAVA